jgi:hypothetical protein
MIVGKSYKRDLQGRGLLKNKMLNEKNSEREDRGKKSRSRLHSYESNVNGIFHFTKYLQKFPSLVILDKSQ